mgnify:CR=1 FL=1
MGYSGYSGYSGYAGDHIVDQAPCYFYPRLCTLLLFIRTPLLLHPRIILVAALFVFIVLDSLDIAFDVRDAWVTLYEIHIVTAVGGLVDTVPDADERRDGLGFVAQQPTPEHLLAAMFRAARRVAKKRQRVSLQKRMMAVDWSWQKPAERYADLYAELVELG